MARKPNARTFGQDIMRGEHVVGGGAKATAVPGGGTKVVREGSKDLYRLKTDKGYLTAVMGKGANSLPVRGGPV